MKDQRPNNGAPPRDHLPVTCCFSAIGIATIASFALSPCRGAAVAPAHFSSHRVSPSPSRFSLLLL
eukprot:1790056-Prymnesium_polylepis.1